VRRNKLGARHDRALDALRSMVNREVQLREETPPSAVADAEASIASNATFIERGEHLRSRLMAFVHGEESIRRAVRREVRRWQNQAFTISRSSDRR
jgi:hypothetical protein